MEINDKSTLAERQKVWYSLKQNHPEFADAVKMLSEYFGKPKAVEIDSEGNKND